MDLPQPGKPTEQAPGGLVNEVASAPGDLPYSEVLARATLLAEQFRHDNTIRPLAPQPDQATVVEATSGSKLLLARAAVYYTIDGRVPGPEDSAVPMTRVRVEWSVLPGFVTVWQAELPAQPAGTMVRYRIGGWREDRQHQADDAPDLWAHDGQGFWFRVPWPAGISTFAYTSEPPAPPLPAWGAEAVIYQIFVDRFHPGSADGRFKPAGDTEIHGGNLAGIKAALPYLADLGVNALWFTPIFESPSYHRYDSTDYYKIDGHVGDDDDLRAVIEEAHARGMRVILDFVPSHLSLNHPAFRAAQGDRNAPSFSWFTFYEWPARYRSFLNDVPSLPSFNNEDPGARDYIIGSAVHWLREFGVDGYRLDHAIGPGMDFWVAFRRACAAVRPEVVLFGEATDTPDSLRHYRGRLHGVVDFPLATSLRHAFALGDWDLNHFVSAIEAYEQYMADGPGRFSFLDNHDMDRFLFLAGGDTTRLKLAALCQFTLAPTPVIYYGTEIGMSQEMGFEAHGFGGDAQARADMPWDPARWDSDLLDFYRRLIALRRAHPILAHGARRTLLLENSDEVLVYSRSAAPDAALAPGDLLVLFNLSEAPRAVALPTSGTGRPALLFKTGSAAVALQFANGQMLITLPARTGVVLGATD